MALYIRILGYLRGHLGVLLAAMAAMVAFAVLDAFSFALLIPFLHALFQREDAGADAVVAPPGMLDRVLDRTVGQVIDLSASPEVAIRGIIIFIVIIFGAKNFFLFWRGYLSARVEQGVTKDLRNQVYDHLLDLDLGFFGRTRTGQIISRLTHDVEQLRILVTREATKLISAVFEFAGAFALMIMISAKLTLAAFVVVPATMVMWGPLLKRLRRGDRRVLDLAGDINTHLHETLTGIRLVKASAAEDFERGRFNKLTLDYFRTFLGTERLRALASPLTEMLTALGTVVLLWYGTQLVLTSHELTGEAFIVFLGLSLKLYSPVKFLSKFPTTIQPGLAGAERVFEFLDAPIEILDRSGATPFPGLATDLTFENVSFEYRAGRPVLKDVSFSVPCDSVVALVGPSGAGKTTIVDLLARFYDVTTGKITVNGQDIRDFSVRSLRESLGVVSQETVLFHDTVAANIAYGARQSDRDLIEKAARAAHAHEFIVELPEGYDTLVGERGTQLSGGQRQRLAIARAILRDPPILILDEATSALDTESERLVQEAIEHLLKGRTVFVIAHRLSTIQRSDVILVMEDGCLVEQGTHGDLLAAEGLYRRLYELQFQDQTPVVVTDGATPEEVGSRTSDTSEKGSAPAGR